ncbi:ADP-dependent glucokinase/phosphofructokinase [Brachybacterium sp. FME24]|uniref:ADP-dependent glucokinase/phosphofructokinase n=1 Tax=Brachybacterium sp. FME24 TaxID=2742605 RepID=UPI0018691A35|nr:ADP-dependent glucokinase/phosphofructokinase [Brachybacterium sp. FME24]
MNTSIVLGLGGCLDSEVALDPSRLQALVDDHAVSLTEIRQPAELRTEHDVLLSVLDFLRDGVGGERYVSTVDAVLAFESHFEHETTLGGTNVRAGRILAQLGHPNVLHVPGRDETFESLLVDGSTLPQQTPPAEYVPHLIVQYPAGLRVQLRDGTLVAAHSNRVILVHDPVSELTPLHDSLPQWLQPGGVLVLSGLNSIRDEQILNARLRALRDTLDDAPAGLRVFYEDSDYHVPAFRRRVWSELASRATVIGMNEDELASFTGTPVDVTDAAQIASAVTTVLENIPGGTLVVHSKYWALAAGAQAPELEAALESGNLAAGARFLDGDRAQATSLDLVRAQPRSPQGEDIARRLPALLGAPVVVVPARTLRAATPTTIGLGDTFLGGLLAGVVDSDAALRTPSTVEVS